MTLKFILIVDSKFKKCLLTLLRVIANNWLLWKVYYQGNKDFLFWKNYLEQMLYIEPNPT